MYERMKYKVGDKVKIRSLEWYNENKDECGVVFVDKQSFVKEMSEYCGMQANINYASEYRYSIDLDDGEWSWTDEMFEYNMEQKNKFEPFERIIFRREHLKEKWTCGEFSHIEGEYYVLAGNECFKIEDTDILPFEGNAHLVGTSDMPCESVELKEGDLVAVADDIEDIVHGYVSIRRFSAIVGNNLYCRENAHKDSREDVAWTYCIPFSQFNPNDMEETKKHILCVKNGKLVRARL